MNKQQIKELIQEIKHSSIPLKSQEILIGLVENQLAADRNTAGRLTFENKDGTWGIKGYDIKKVPNELYGAICKLRDYERIIINPQKLLEVDESYAEICKELAEYKKLEKQGLLLRLPCKEVFESSGDTVWYIFEDELVECVNCGVSMSADGKLYIYLAYEDKIFPYRQPIPEIDADPTDWCTEHIDLLVGEWNKTIFLSKEEAEQALKERNRHGKEQSQ